MNCKEYLKLGTGKKDRALATEYNKELIEEYPWLLPNKRTSKYNYGFTLLDGVPEGWRIKFQDEFCKDIDKVINRYKLKTESICACCGKTATYINKISGLPFCGKCTTNISTANNTTSSVMFDSFVDRFLEQEE